MEFIYVDLGYLCGDEIIEVKLWTAANVHLLDSTNFQKFKSGYDFYGYGGYIKSSPYRISVPYPGKWYLTFDLGGYGGTIKYDYNIIKPNKYNIEVVEEEEEEVVETYNHFTLPDKTIVFYKKLPNGKVKLKSVMRDGMPRSSSIQMFNSVEELYDYCINRNWSRF